MSMTLNKDDKEGGEGKEKGYYLSTIPLHYNVVTRDL